MVKGGPEMTAEGPLSPAGQLLGEEKLIGP